MASNKTISNGRISRSIKIFSKTIKLLVFRTFYSKPRPYKILMPNPLWVLIIDSVTVTLLEIIMLQIFPALMKIG